MSDVKVAVVTGANKGLGFAIVKLLCQRQPDWLVYLTCRDVERGQQAILELKKSSNLGAKFHQLDVVSNESIQSFATFLKETHPRGIHVLVNNAAIFELKGAYQGEDAKVKVDYDLFRRNVGTNYFGTLNVCQHILPLIADGGRVVNVSGGLALTVFNQLSPNLQNKFRNCWSHDELTELMKQFVEIADEDVRSQGWMTGDALDQYSNQHGLEWLPYCVSKLAVVVLARIQQKTFNETPERRNVAVNACSPGLIKTDMNPRATRLPEEGAEVAVYLATIPPGDTELRGNFLNTDKQIVNF